jgi:hypothetical protein
MKQEADSLGCGGSQKGRARIALSFTLIKLQTLLSLEVN